MPEGSAGTCGLLAGDYVFLEAEPRRLDVLSALDWVRPD